MQVLCRVKISALMSD